MTHIPSSPPSPSLLCSCLCRDTLKSFDSTVKLLILRRVSAGLFSAQYPRFRDLLIKPTLVTAGARQTSLCTGGKRRGKRVPQPLYLSLFETVFLDVKHCQSAQRHENHHVFT